MPHVLERNRARRWPLVVGVALAGAVSGALAALILQSVWSEKQSSYTRPPPEPLAVAYETRASGARLAGAAETTVKDLLLKDPEGYVVLKVGTLNVSTKLEDVSTQVVRVPRGHAHDVEVLIRRGRTGRVSLAEAFGKDREGAPEKPGLPLQIGPLTVVRAQLTLALGSIPVVISVDEAVVRVQRQVGDGAPKVLLSGIRGVVKQPSPAQSPIILEAGEGVVDLAGGPLVDLRARVCIGESELRVRIEMPQRRTRVRMTVDARGFLAQLAVLGLDVAALVKTDVLSVSTGSVRVQAPTGCGRSSRGT